MVEVVEGVDEDEQSGGASVDKGSPPPAMILPRELEVQQRDRDEGGHYYKQDEGDKEDAEEGVDLVAPDRGEDVVQLDVDGREGQESGHKQLRQGVSVPRCHFGHFAGHFVGATGRLELLCEVATHHGAHDGQRKVHEQNDRHHQL